MTSKTTERPPVTPPSVDWEKWLRENERRRHFACGACGRRDGTHGLAGIRRESRCGTEFTTAGGAGLRSPREANGFCEACIALAWDKDGKVSPCSPTCALNERRP